MFVVKFLFCFSALCATNVAFAEHRGELFKIIPRPKMTSNDVMEVLVAIQIYMNDEIPNVVNLLSQLYTSIKEVMSSTGPEAEQAIRTATTTLKNKFEEWQIYADVHFGKNVQSCLVGLDLAYQFSSAAVKGVQLCTTSYNYGFLTLSSQSKNKLYSIQAKVPVLQNELSSCEDEACIGKVGQDAQDLYDSLPATITDITKNVILQVNSSTGTYTQCADRYVNEYTGEMQDLQQESYMCVVSMIGEEIPS